MTPIIPHDGGLTDATVFICLSFARMYDDDCFPGLPDSFQVLHYDEYNSTRLSHYAEYYCGSGAKCEAKKDAKKAIETLWQYGLDMEAQGHHHILQMAGRI